MLQKEDNTLDPETFYCSGCGSDRVAGIMLMPLNDKPGDVPGTWIPTVSFDEIATVRALVDARYWYYCFACAKTKDIPNTDGGVQH